MNVRFYFWAKMVTFCIIHIGNRKIFLKHHSPPPIHAWMNGYSTLLHNIAPGKYIVIKVEYGLQLRFKIFLKKSDRKKQQQK